MAIMLENYGLDFLGENDETMEGFIGYVIQEGKPICGYYGDPYFYKSIGNPEFWVQTDMGCEGKLQVVDFDTHTGGNCVWEMRNTGIDITPDDACRTKRTFVFHTSESEGMLPIELISADVLPSFCEGDMVKMQVIALPLDIQYYKDEDSYAEAQPKSKNGEKWMVKTGAMLPISFLYNHHPSRYEKGKKYDDDNHLAFTAVVKKLYHGVFGMDDKQHNTFIRCIVDTDYGELEFDHTLEQVPEELRDNIQEGAIICGTCVLSGDVAIYEYEKGIVKDFEHNLRLLRYTLQSGDPKRLKCVLDEMAVYRTDAEETIYIGAEQIIRKIEDVHTNREKEHIVCLATIVSTDGDDLAYPVGTRCAIIGEQEDAYQAIAFIDVNEDGMITDIRISRDSRYHFQVD